MGDYTLDYPGGQLPLEAVDGTEEPSSFDVSAVLKTTGRVALDIGFVNTASCKSAITFIDGDRAILRYSGYPIEQLAEKSTFLETSYLLIYGELPTADQLTNSPTRSATTPCCTRRCAVSSRPSRARRTRWLCCRPGERDLDLLPGQPRPVRLQPCRDVDDPAAGQAAHDRVVRPQEVRRAAVPLPGQPPRLRPQLPADDLRRPSVEYEVDPVVARALDMLFVLHADHEQNCSTSTVRLVGSANANLFASVSAGVNALFGPLHGGANQAVLEMLQRIHQSDDDVDAFVDRVKRRNAA